MALTWQQALNEPDQSWPSKDARTLLNVIGETADQATCSVIIERLNKPRHGNQCIHTMTDLSEVSHSQQLTCCLISESLQFFSSSE